MQLMAQNGISTSRWANGSSLERENRRKCPSCGMSVFGDLCLRCAHNPKILNDGQDEAMSSISDIGRSIFTSRTQARTSSTRTINTHHANIPHEADGHNTGLSASRWAPRNLVDMPGGQKAQVWTRTIARPPLEASHTSNPVPLPQDLPYQVQHYILAMIQRVLEEGCFYFAQRWIPDSLQANRWDCPEAVELSKWREFLPANMSANAVRPMSNYTLNQALGHAVQVRNKAVHRHLCDNDEIRKMVLQAQDMMYMFSDVTRSEKMHHLWIELNNWDVRNREDPQLARHNLEEVLKVISERPIDDMDWTPNVVSLLELPSDTNGQDDAYGEAMDLD